MIVVTLFCPLIFLGNVVHYKFPASSSHLTGVAQGNNGQICRKGSLCLCHLCFNDVNRAAVRHLLDHVGAVEALWRTSCSANIVRQLVTLQLMCSAMPVLCARKVVS